MYKPVGSSKTLDRPVLRSEVECAQGSEPTGLVGSRFEGADLFQSQILCGAIYYVFTGLFSYKNNHIQMTYIPLTNWKANFYPFQKCELCSPNVGQFDVMKVESIITIHTKYMVYKPFVQESNVLQSAAISKCINMYIYICFLRLIITGIGLGPYVSITKFTRLQLNDSVKTQSPTLLIISVFPQIEVRHYQQHDLILSLGCKLTIYGARPELN